MKSKRVEHWSQSGWWWVNGTACSRSRAIKLKMEVALYGACGYPKEVSEAVVTAFVTVAHRHLRGC